MVKSKLKQNISRILVIAVMALAFLSVLGIMRMVQQMLYADAEINLSEILTQNKDLITGRISIESNNVRLAGSQITESIKNKSDVSNEELHSAFTQYIENGGDTRLFIADKNGQAYFPDGTELDISGRNYYKLALKGEMNISDRVVSRKSGEEVFIISIPLYAKDEIVGTLQKQFTSEEMHEMCAVSLFSNQGYTNIINSDGYVVVSSVNDEYNNESANYYWMLYSQGNQKEAEKLEADIRANKDGLVATTVKGTPTLSVYTPIDELHDWYLITSVATSAVSSNANEVIRMFYVILIFVVAAFTFFILYFMRYKNKQQMELSRIAFVDSLTGGNTYNKFETDIKELLEDNPDKSYSLLAFDIDNFKYVNNFYGFDYGDTILKSIYQKVSLKLSGSEMLARISGDHFVALIEDDDPERLEAILRRVQDTEGFKVYISAGLYKIKDREESVSLMMDKAGMAVQDVKGIPHRILGYYSDIYDAQMIKSEQMKRAIEKALAMSEIVPFFQPKVDVTTRKLVGAEALARWITSDGVLIPPGEFIPVCERTGLVAELDMMVFEKALAFLRSNIDAGMKCVPISVNFSRMHLLNDQFVDVIVSKLEEYGVPPELVELELTESVIFENYSTISEFINVLHAKGLSISMDDFGSGYSSLNMLKDVCIDVMKIDREFLKDTTDSERQRVIFTTIARMAAKLGIEVVVEGVETEGNIELMKESGCFIAQGFYYSRPVDMEKFEEIFRRGTL